ncbi:MAG TPA: hypothetical protein ACFYD3_02525 [Candidatus Hypogeohydataceae bacterium YC41]
MEKVVGARGRWYFTIPVALAALLALEIAGMAVVQSVVLPLVSREIMTVLPEIRVVVPGTHKIYLAEPGRYKIFYEYYSVVGSKIYSTSESLPGSMVVTLQSKTDSRGIMISRPSMSESYKVGGRSGIAVFEFQIEEPGAYIFTAYYADGASRPDVVFAIGHTIFQSTILVLFGEISLPLFGVIIASAVLFYMFMYRLWQLAQMSDLRIQKPSPGLAIGLTFVPFFNLYWIFILYRNLALHLNHLTRHNKIPVTLVTVGVALSIGSFLFSPLMSINPFLFLALIWAGPIILQTVLFYFYKSAKELIEKE